MAQCLFCNNFTTNAKFCTRSCSVTYTNTQRKSRTIESRSKSSTSIKAYFKSIGAIEGWRKEFKDSICGEYSRIHLCICKVTGKTWYSTTVKTIHPTVTDTRKSYAYQCGFKFNLTDFPEYFKDASDLITTYGWYAASNRGNNLNGCSRDHLYSVSEGFKNQIDPKILSHPANCRIVPHKINQSKRAKCLITLDELKSKIDQFEKVFGLQYRI